MKWKKYKEVIISLSRKGQSSTDIAEIISKMDKSTPKKSADRTVRRLLEKWVPKADIKPLKVLVFDIETSPLKAYTWGKWNQNIQDSHIIDDWFMISWAAKWLLEDEVISMVQTPTEALAKNDERISKGLWELLDEADVVIAHNALKFDIKRAKARFLLNGLPPTSPFEVIDTLAHARKSFALSSNRLDYIAGLLGFDGKIPTDFTLWKDSLIGDDKALETMDTYCRQDVRVLEDVYLRLRPYIQPHPNIGMHITDGLEHCPSCGSDDLVVDGTYNTTVNTFDAIRCKKCGSISRSRTSRFTVEQRKKILSSTPK